MKRPLVLAILLLLAVGAAVGAAMGWLYPRPLADAAWQGYADAEYVRIGPPLQGLLTAVPVKAGDQVVEGQMLFAHDDAADRAALDGAVANVAEAEARLANLQLPGRDPEIAQAEANLADTRAAAVRAARALEGAEAVVRTHVVSVQQRDLARADALSAAAREQAAASALVLKQATLGRVQEIAAQTAALAGARAQRAQAEWRLAQRRMAAPAAGLIADIFARPGETPNAGAAVVSLLPPGNMLVRFFVPEPALPGLRPGQRVGIGCDACPANLTGTISFISPRAEYTPPVIYSEVTRSKLVYQVEARPASPEVMVLKPGQPVTIRLLP